MVYIWELKNLPQHATKMKHVDNRAPSNLSMVQYVMCFIIKQPLQTKSEDIVALGERLLEFINHLQDYR